MNKSVNLLNVLSETTLKESGFTLSKLSNLVGYRIIKKVYNGDIDDLGKHSYGQLYTLKSSRGRALTIKYFIIYSNFGQSNTKRPIETIGDGKGHEIAITANDILSRREIDQINAEFEPLAFDSVNSSKLLQRAAIADTVIHIDQNGRILASTKGD